MIDLDSEANYVISVRDTDGYWHSVNGWYRDEDGEYIFIIEVDGKEAILGESGITEFAKYRGN